MLPDKRNRKTGQMAKYPFKSSFEGPFIYSICLDEFIVKNAEFSL